MLNDAEERLDFVRGYRIRKLLLDENRDGQHPGIRG
jgi:hypothetical protein